MKISLIAAISENRALGKNNDLIYKIPEDLKRFRELTSGHPIIMGRKTYESIGRVLPNRVNIIVTRDKKFKVEGAVVVGSLEEALKVAKKSLGRFFPTYPSPPSSPSKPSSQSSPSGGRGPMVVKSDFRGEEDQGEKEIFVVGGGQIFEQAIKRADKLYLTIIHQTVSDADIFFPDYSDFKEINSENHEWNGIEFSFKEFSRT